MQGRKKVKNFDSASCTDMYQLHYCIPLLVDVYKLHKKQKDEIWAVPPKVLPAIAQWGNYADALADGTFLRYMWNSAYTAIIITVVVLFNSAMFAYALTHIRFRWKNC